SCGAWPGSTFLHRKLSIRLFSKNFCGRMHSHGLGRQGWAIERTRREVHVSALAIAAALQRPKRNSPRDPKATRVGKFALGRRRVGLATPAVTNSARTQLGRLKRLEVLLSDT